MSNNCAAQPNFRCHHRRTWLVHVRRHVHTGFLSVSDWASPRLLSLWQLMWVESFNGFMSGPLTFSFRHTRSSKELIQPLVQCCTAWPVAPPQTCCCSHTPYGKRQCVPLSWPQDIENDSPQQSNNPREELFRVFPGSQWILMAKY